MKSFEDSSFMKEAMKEASDFLAGMQETVKGRGRDPHMDKLVHTCWDCVLMLEKYHYTVFFKKDNDATTFQQPDMEKWLNVYYPDLVKTGIISDYTFFSRSYYDAVKSNRPIPTCDQGLGVGSDGRFVRAEYINLRYQLYKFIFLNYLENLQYINMLEKVPMSLKIIDCINMLEPYLLTCSPYNLNQLITLNKADKESWLTTYFPSLVETSLLNDYTISDPMALRKNYGIGNDASGFCHEFQYFLSEAYRYLLLPVYMISNFK